MVSLYFQRTARAVSILISIAAAVQGQGCRHGPVVARQFLTDPIMRMAPEDPIGTPYQQASPNTQPIPPDTVNARVGLVNEPGEDVRATQLDSELRSTVELYGGLGLEAGYGYLTDRQVVQKLDGFAGPMQVERTAYGPNAALLIDDGVSLLRLGYRYRKSWDGELHEPCMSIRTAVLGDDTLLELSYGHTFSSLKIPLSRFAANEPIDDHKKSDRIQLAVEQGFLPGWKIRWDLAVRLEQGFLQSPYRLVSLWAHRFADSQQPATPPRVEAEKHPGSRARWGTQLRVRRWLPVLSSALDISIEYGSGSWRVEHSAVAISYFQRIGNPVTLSLGAGLYHQTRAVFYRDDYLEGPAGSYWTADRKLCSFLAYWAQTGLAFRLFGNQKRLLGFLRRLSIRFNARIVLADYDWPGAGPNHGFTAYASLAADQPRKYDAGLSYLGVFEFEGGF